MNASNKKESVMPDMQWCFENSEEAADLINELQQRLAEAEAKIDSLMLEYCPDEMTPKQLEEWGNHQRPVEEGTSYE